MSGREDAIIALSGLLQTAYPWNSAPSRRLKLWSDVPPNLRPALFIFEGGREQYNYSGVNCKRTIEIRLFIYTNAHDSDGSIDLNNIMDAIDSALQPVGADIQTGRQTLGGIVHHCRVEGEVFKDPGDLDGDGLLIIPIQILFP